MRHIFGHWMGAFVIATTFVLTGGCASNKNEVKCDGRLAPINKILPAKSAAATPLSPSFTSPVRASVRPGKMEGK